MPIVVRGRVANSGRNLVAVPNRTLVAATDFAPELGDKYALNANSSGNSVPGHFLDPDSDIIQ